ncbi:MAG: hypothetical protein Q9219_001260 [cf. Caloplaca sp. 3 TL-2023]
MKWDVILGNFLAATATALPSAPHSQEDAASSLEARDVPLWAANFANAVVSNGAGFGRVQFQYYNDTEKRPGAINNNGPPIPVVPHRILGNALKIHLNGRATSPNGFPEMRWEAFPPTAVNFYKEGDERYFRVDFVLDKDVPISQTNSM